MAINAQRNHLVCYDIADPDRLTQVHRTVRRWGIPLQYSVFLVPATSSGIARLSGDLARIINAREDDIRIYPLPNRIDIATLGRQGLPQGINLTDASKVGRVFALLAAARKPR
jgi:CRISPR-associated protein Cas2